MSNGRLSQSYPVSFIPEISCIIISVDKTALGEKMGQIAVCFILLILNRSKRLIESGLSRVIFAVALPQLCGFQFKTNKVSSDSFKAQYLTNHSYTEKGNRNPLKILNSDKQKAIPLSIDFAQEPVFNSEMNVFTWRGK